MTLTYLYCLVAARTPPRSEGAPPGVPDAGRVRFLAAEEGRWLAVADVPRAAYSQDALAATLEDLDAVSRAALGHEAVVEHLMTLGDVLPVRLFTLYDDDRRALDDVEQRRDAIAATLARVAGCREWGVRITADAPAAAPPGDREAGERDAERPGTEFLRRKQAARALAREARERAALAAGRWFDSLAESAVEAQRKPLPEGVPSRLLIDGVLLVRTAEHAMFEAALREAARGSEADGLRLAANGPWPPYHFVGAAP